MTKWAFLNTEFVLDQAAVLHYRDLAFQRGYGVFDFLKVVRGQPVFLEDHLERFFYSAGQLHLTLKQQREQLDAIIRELIVKNAVSECGIRLSLTGGYSEDGYHPATPNLVISVHTFQLPTPDQFSKGIRLMTHSFQRQLPHIKSIDYLMAVMLQPQLKERQLDDILYHQNGIITECPRANLFIVTAENKLVTPAHNILKGITRKKILKAAFDFMDVEERDITLDELKNAREVFISSTTKMVLPVARVDDFSFGTERTIAKRLHEILFKPMQEPALI
ncbi:MAG: aminotransferase class IV [Flavisolibacter sp.]